jgi:hypothetical protein
MNVCEKMTATRQRGRKEMMKSVLFGEERGYESVCERYISDG